ncbi:MAG TPA: hypothetical protein VMT85_09550 [Thermoanaerobaculia bacterium]|nr:hypothetical protein [Thermoanaerobaculia bacterium]
MDVDQAEQETLSHGRFIAEAEPRQLVRFLSCALLANLTLLSVYLLVSYPQLFHSDSATKNLLAREILQSGTLFPRGFDYTSNIWLVHGHLLVLAVSPLLGTGLAAHTAAMSLFAVLFLLAVWGLLVYLRLSMPARLTSLLVISAGLSSEWAENVYGQGAYGFLCLLVIGMTVATGRYLVDRAEGFVPGAFAVSVYFLAGLYGGRGAHLLLIPVAGALMALPLRGAVGRPLVCLLAAIGGVVARGQILGRVTFTPFVGSYFSDAEGDRSIGAGAAVLRLFDLLPHEPLTTANPLAFVHAARFVLLLLLAGLGGGALLMLRRRLEPRRRFFVLYCVGLLMVTLYTSTFLSELSGQPRYLVPAAFAVFVASGLFLDESRRLMRVPWVIAASSLLLVVSAASYALPAMATPPQEPPRLAGLRDLVQLLDDAEVRSGYAPYWYSGAIAVGTNYRVDLRPVSFDAGLPVPVRHLTVDSWYAQGGQGRTALVLPTEEDALLDEEFLSSLVGAPERVVEAGDYRLLIYGGDVFPSLPAWRKANLEEGAVERLAFPASVLPTQVGTLQSGSLWADAGTSPGVLAYGPYVRLPPGAWRVIFDVEIRELSGEGPVGSWDLVTDRGDVELARGALEERGRRRVAVRLSLPTQLAPPGLEARVFYAGRGELLLHGVEVERVRDESD